MRNPSPFSLLQHAALSRLACVIALLAGLWLAIHWAVILP
jgi:hypothetical protein